LPSDAQLQKAQARTLPEKQESLACASGWY
jgi:hypothetical protein